MSESKVPASYWFTYFTLKLFFFDLKGTAIPLINISDKSFSYGLLAEAEADFCHRYDNDIYPDLEGTPSQAIRKSSLSMPIQSQEDANYAKFAKNRCMAIL